MSNDDMPTDDIDREELREFLLDKITETEKKVEGSGEAETPIMEMGKAVAYKEIYSKFMGD